MNYELIDVRGYIYLKKPVFDWYTSFSYDVNKMKNDILWYYKPHVSICKPII